MNYSGFKKVHEDNDKAVLKNTKGHSITVAKKALSKKHLDALKELPLHQAFGTGKQASEDTEPQATPTVDAINRGLADTAPNENQDWESSSGKTSLLDPVDRSVQAQPDQAPAQAAQPQAPEEAPDAPVPEPITPDQHAQMELQQYHANDKAWENDLNNGHVSPKTYQDLFNSRSTLGKIGDLFGLLVSGAGAGLTHSPNAVLQMMDQEIQNDLKAQQHSKDNALNFIKANQAHLLSQSQIPLNKAQAKLAEAEANIKAKAQSYMQASRTAFHSLVMRTQALPVGSKQRTDEENMLGLMYPLMGGNNAAVADQAVAASALLRSREQENNQGNSEINYNKFNALQLQSQLKIPGAPSSEDLSQMTQEAKQVGDISMLKTDFLEAFDKLDKMALAGTLNKSLRDAIVDPLLAKATKLGEGRYTESAHKAYSSMTPTFGDKVFWLKNREKKRQAAEEFFETLKGSTPTLNRFGVRQMPDQKIKIIRPDGAIGKIPAANLEKALKMGWKKAILEKGN